MERLKIQYKNLLASLDTFESAIHLFKTTSKQKFLIELRDPADEMSQKIILNYENVLKGLRDSLMQRFEYCVDTLWKYLKDYLETVIGTDLEIKGPRPVIRATGNARLMSEDDVELAMLMIDSRNRSSRIYKEEIAQEIADQIHEYHKLIRKIVDKVKP